VTRTLFIAAPLIAMTAIVLAFAPVTVNAQEAAASAEKSPFSSEQKAALDTAIHDYLMANPQVIMDSVEQYRQNQEANEAKGFVEKIKERHDDIYNDAASPVVGNKKGDVTLVEFFDYNCGYCKQAFRDVLKILEEDKKLRVVFKEFPILSESSHTAARYALAAGRQGKYMEFHTALMTQSGQMNEGRMETLGKELGLDVKKLKEDANSPIIRAEIEKNLALGRDVGIAGTPAFVIGDDALRGHYGLEALRKVIADKRAAQKEDGKKE
jgi:protein-disulfide isomerase